MDIKIMKFIFFHWRSLEPPWEGYGEIYPILGHFSTEKHGRALSKVISENYIPIPKTHQVPQKIIIKFSPGGAYKIIPLYEGTRGLWGLPLNVSP